ncbi:elongation factor 4 [Candidatus Absconditicoccus praedator]|uniref:elongation factor 4 n=1 Tax=Candidatus Absconditicoccus praedator TaxID=2735562 RepID=UPI001E41F29A|nr:GTP-binding protein [Candidatus Absconditicoccus praedator]UFX82708.1 GTP-binding protein [Candidatus Absconditicoccus praedator]
MKSNIRNFCIVAHIDHGKSTLADRMLEITKTLEKSDKGQVLDKLDLEQERGITIKLTPARMHWKGYEFNLIDTPGHVDFQYEVSRSLSSVEGTILLVDATQGIQAQTLSTLYMAIDYGLEIIPVLNKIDLPAAQPERVAEDIENLVGIDKEQIISVSAKTGENVDKVLDTIIDKIESAESFYEQNKSKFFLPSSSEQLKNTTGVSRALIFDSVYDKYKGVVAYVKVLDGEFTKKDTINLLYSENQVVPSQIGYFAPDYIPTDSIKEGQIGYIVTGQKSVREAKIGDTMLSFNKTGSENIKAQNIDPKSYKDLRNFAIPGFKRMKPFVYSGVYPMQASDYDKLKDAFEKLVLNDSAIEYDNETSSALGHGFRAGFLGTLHMDITRQRLEKEYDIQTVFTIPNAQYLVKLKNLSHDIIKQGTNITKLINTNLYKHIIEEDVQLTLGDIPMEIKESLKPWIVVSSGGQMPNPGDIDIILEPYSSIEVVGPQEYGGEVMQLCNEHRGIMQGMESIDENRILRRYKIPLAEIIVDFYDKLKSNTQGYATMNYEFLGYEQSDLVRLDVLVNHEPVEAFSMVVHKDKAYSLGKSIVEKLKDLIPKHMFPIPLQASIGNKVIARENIPALKKDVLAKCYGGDVTRKRKLLEKQKEGKKKMKQMGKVSVPNDIFLKMISR